MDLGMLGWSDALQSAFEQLNDAELAPARVSEQHRAGYRVLGAFGEQLATPTGRLRERGEAPAVGDFVAVRQLSGEARALIAHVLPRRSALIRKRPERAIEPQVLAANLDYVFVVSALGGELNLRSIERYTAFVWESGAKPVVVLAKADLCADVDAALALARSVSPGAPVHALAAPRGQGLLALQPYLVAGRTAALVGTSGAGKTTLLNNLLGEPRFATAEVRASDHKGRHTTTHRQLVVLPTGGALIDTPGMRELALWSEEGEGVAQAFDDIERVLAEGCRFADCQHQREPGCALLAALHAGRLSIARVDSYHKLQRERAHHARRADERAQLEHAREQRRFFSSVRKQMRRHPKR